PGFQLFEVRLDFGCHLVRDGREFRCKQRTDADRWTGLADAAGPVAAVRDQASERIGVGLVERREPAQGGLAMPCDHRPDQLRLGREMMVDACLAYLHPFGDVGEAETVVAASGKQLDGALDDLLRLLRIPRLRGLGRGGHQHAAPCAGCRARLRICSGTPTSRASASTPCAPSSSGSFMSVTSGWPAGRRLRISLTVGTSSRNTLVLSEAVCT